ncbi:MAG: DUF4302 domain-containing protein [Bacteroidota bacterium]
MKKVFYVWVVLILVLTSCKDDDINLFDKSSDERAEEAITALKNDLTEPSNGWKIKYKPESGAGSFYVLMKFNDDNTVNIKTDLSADNNAYQQQTITYRIDNSLGLELILESYSFFSYLFELDQATFGAEYEFDYVNKTPNGELVFKSKTDLGTPTILTFEEASASDVNLLGPVLSGNLETQADDIDRYSSSLRLFYDTKDLVFYVSMNHVTRTINFNAASKKTDTQVSQNVNHSTGYFIKGDSLVLESPLSGTFVGNSISIKGIRFNSLTDTQLNVCAGPIPVHAYQGVTSANHAVTLETTILDVYGKTFATRSDFYFSPLIYILNNGVSADAEILEDLPGAQEMHLYYNLPLNDGTKLFGIGFALENANDSTTLALREFTPTLVNNNLIFTFKPGFRLFGDKTPDADLNNINIYLDALTGGDDTYVFAYNQDIYEFYNPCTGWNFVFFNGNQ